MKLTQTQREAIADLTSLSEGDWQGYGYGSGKYRIALRALKLRVPDAIEIDGVGANQKYRLTDMGKHIMCPGDHGESCCGNYAAWLRALSEAGA